MNIFLFTSIMIIIVIVNTKLIALAYFLYISACHYFNVAAHVLGPAHVTRVQCGHISEKKNGEGYH